MSGNGNNTSPITQLLNSPEGQDVINTLWDTFWRTRNPIQALNSARQVAENNGVWDRAIVIVVMEVLDSIFRNFGERR